MPKQTPFLTFMLLCALPAAAAAPPPQADLPSRVEAASHASQLPIDERAKGLEQLLRKLRTRASLMTVVAHPDDEDGGMLTLESRGRGTRVGIMTLTRGEGGQNIMSADSWDELGLLRTEELLAADRYYNTDQFFGTETDFGFSKTLEEAMQQWSHDRVLRDVVRAVRMYRPLVLTSTFIGALTDGHGHHQVSGEMAQEAFLAAGNPNLFPEQIKEGLLPWQPLKVYARLPFFSVTEKGMYDYATQKWAPVRFHDYVNNTDINGTPSANVTEREGVADPALGGETYVQVAFQGLLQQKSQIPSSVTAPTGAHDVSYHRFGTKVQTKDEEQSFFDGIDVTLVGIASLAPGEHTFLRADLEHLQQLVDNAQKNFNASAPEKSAPALRDGLLAVNDLLNKVGSSQISDAEKNNVAYELHIKQQQFNDALALALNIQVNASVASATNLVVPGQSVDVDVKTTAAPAAKLVSVDLHTTFPTSSVKLQAARQAGDAQLRVTVPKDAPPTVPYFYRPSVEQPYYDLRNPALAGMARTPYPITARTTFQYEGVQIMIDRVVLATNHGGAEPLVVAPAVAIEASPLIRYLAPPGRPFKVTAHITSNVTANDQSTIKLSVPAGWQSIPPQHLTQAPLGASRDLDFQVTPEHIIAKPYKVAATGIYNGKPFDSSFHPVGYPGLRTAYESKPAITRVVGVEAHVAPNLKIGYVMGTGDNVPDALENLGATVHLLTDEELKTADLAQYDAILLGIRTYGAREVLKQVNTRLLDYVKQGGSLIVQYNSPQYDHNYGPYEYSLTSDSARVVEEQAAVKILDPASPLLTWPNQITTNDFANWVEERGHSFMKSWDPHYVALTETNDVGQAPQRGGLLLANYGKGTYVYIAYALYRQLDEGVPGAYRLLANLISQKQNPHRSSATALSSHR